MRLNKKQQRAQEVSSALVQMYLAGYLDGYRNGSKQYKVKMDKIAQGAFKSFNKRFEARLKVMAFDKVKGGKKDK